MKKLSTMLAILAFGSATMVAAPVTGTGVRSDLKVTGATPEFYQMHQALLRGEVSGDEILDTRSFTDVSGNTYELKIQMRQETMNNLLTFSDKDGNPYNPSFDDLPYYCVDYTLTRTKKGDESYSTMVIMHLAWPSNYIYDQVFTYTGEVDADGLIPVGMRDYAPASIDELANNTARCRVFQESDGVGTGDLVDGKWSYYSILPNELLQNPSLYDDQLAYTELSADVASQLEFTMFDPEEDWTEVTNRIYLKLIDTQTSRRLQCSYKGDAAIEGFAPKTQDLPEFGDLHLFNTGLQSSELFGDNNEYPGDFGALTAFYYVIGDQYLGWEIAPEATSFNKNNISNTGLDLPAGEALRDHANYLSGYLYANAAYANDINLDPTEESFQMLEPKQVEVSDDVWYADLVPSEGAIIPYSVGDMNGNMESWSENYGTRVIVGNFYEICGAESTLGWGYDRGFCMDFVNNYLKLIHAESTGKLYYHYDPKDMKLYRELSLVGTKEYTAVENIAADNASVVAANGVLTVTPAENAVVAVYTLDGVCVKSANVAAGNSVSVEGKGLYVVTVNGAAKKVVL